jgi:NAD(P)-dependent dehydrogenase (short-subunit alcohol dehydrogenase family)
MPELASKGAVLITGAAGGIGTATAKTLAEHGYRVYAGVRGGAGAPVVVPEARQQAGSAGIRVIPLDVTDQESISAAVKLVSADLASTGQDGAGLHAVINNAGVIVGGPLELIPESELHRQFAVNVYGPVLVTQAFLPLLREGKGRLINISAPTARLAVPFAGGISASKAALESFSSAARVELAPWGIPVIVIEPGATDTDIFAKSATAAAVALEASRPERVVLYRVQLDAVAAATAKQRMAPVQTVVDVIVAAVETRKPRAFYTAGRDARMVGTLARLPRRTRDRLLARVLGIAALPASGTGAG